jgi:hypothetical protein
MPPVPSAQTLHMRAFTQRLRDDRHTVGVCLWCDWRYEGTAAEERAAAIEHRRDKHPNIRVTQRKTSKATMVKPKAPRHQWTEEG